MTMRPKLNAHTTYILVPDGIYLRNNGTALYLRGKNLDHFLELLPCFDGHYTLEEITQGSSPGKKMLVTKFLEALLKSGFLKDMSQDQTHTLTQAELATYSSNITFIDSFQTAAVSRFASFRVKQLLVIGSGLGFTALVQASLRSGIKQINIIRTPESGPLTDAQPDLINLFSQNDPAQRIQLLPPPQWDNESDVLNTIHTCDTLLHISDRPMLARAQMLNRLCIEQKKTFIQAIVVDDHVWVGPLVSAETGGCWECAWRRLQSNLVASSEERTPFCDLPTVPISPFFALPTAIMAANRLIFELFKHFTQAGSLESAGSLIDIHPSSYPPTNQGSEENLTLPPAFPDADNLWGTIPNTSYGSVPVLCEQHVFLPHPHCHSCQHPTVPTVAQFLNQIQQLQHQAPLNPATFCENIAHLVDRRLGLFTSLDTDDFVQAPLAVYKVGISNPMALKHPGKPLEVIGVGIDRSSAKVHACQRACELYAASLVDHRRLLPRETIRQQTSPTIPVDQLIGAPLLLKDIETWTWALDLHTQQASLIPAPLAFPPLLHGELRAEDKRGIGSGMSWAEAICQALFDWCTFLAIEQMRDIQQQYPQVDLTMIPMTPEGVHLHHLLQIVGEQVSVYDVTGVLQVPTFAICAGKEVLAYSTHCDVAQALSAGLRQAMQQYQSRQAQQPEYAIAPMPDLPRQEHRGNRKGGHSISAKKSCAEGAPPQDDSHLLGDSYGRQGQAQPLQYGRGPEAQERLMDVGAGSAQGTIPTAPASGPVNAPASLHVPTDDHRRYMPYQMIPEAWPARQEWLQQTLQAHGFSAWALPLDHDPTLVQVFPYVVRVLLAKI